MESQILAEQQFQDTLQKMAPTKRGRIIRKIIMTALGSIPWVGGALAAIQAYAEEGGQIKTDTLQKQWLEEHRRKIEILAKDLSEVIQRLESLGEEIETRLESEEYLTLIRKAFRGWDQADTQQKRDYIKKLITNAGGTTVCEDDLVRLFLDWLSLYHEAHFLVIREIYKNPGCTRYQIWQNIHGDFPRDDSAEADLFRLLIGDLTLGRVIRQHRETNGYGQFIKKARAPRKQSSGTMKSAFDDEEEYELTELGRQFVHYVFSDIVTRIEGAQCNSGNSNV